MGYIIVARCSWQNVLLLQLDALCQYLSMKHYPFTIIYDDELKPNITSSIDDVKNKKKLDEENWWEWVLTVEGYN